MKALKILQPTQHQYDRYVLGLLMGDCDYLYHERTGFPEQIHQRLRQGVDLSLNPTSHARDKAKQNKYLKRENKSDYHNTDTYISIPQSASIGLEQVFEVGVSENKNITKLGFRLPTVNVVNSSGDYSEYELCPIVDPQDGAVITIYINRKDDSHDTLNSSNYDQPHVSSPWN